MFCSKCGSEVSETEQFCHQCGAPVKHEPEPAEQANPFAANPNPAPYQTSPQEQLARYRQTHSSPMVWAILTTILCCLPLGVVSIVMACKENSCLAVGDFVGAERANKSARTWATWSAVLGILGGGLSMLSAL